MSLVFTEITDAASWNEFVNHSDFGHPLQLWGWGESKRENRWTPYRVALVQGEEIVAAAQVLFWPIPRTKRFIAYVPRGPVADPGSSEAAKLLEDLTKWAKSRSALYLRIEPAWLEVTLAKGWKRARHQLQMRQTFTIDLEKSEEELQEAMVRKHRQYIRKAEREGVIVQRVTEDNLADMYRLYLDTASRAGFGIHSRDYYRLLFEQFGEANYLYYAEVEGKVEGFLWLAASGKTAYELYGGISSVGGEHKVNYLLKWKAMTELKAAGYDLYDFNGRLNEGVSQFKVGFGPDETDWIGTYDYVFNAVGYQLWERLWPVAKPVGRRIMKAVKR
jgi:peptidoglycan pentaglycine glycine transferase (the first glycine)